MEFILEIIVMIGILTSLIFMIMFLIARRAILDDRQTYHKTMSVRQIKRSRRFMQRSELKKHPRLRRLRYIQFVSVALMLAGFVGSNLSFQNMHATWPVKFGSGLALLVGGCGVIAVKWKLNRFIIDLETAADAQEPSSLLATPAALLKRELRYFKGYTISIGILVACLFLQLQFLPTTVIAQVNTTTSSSNGNVQQIQQVKPVATKTTTGEKMAMFTQYHKVITTYDLSTDEVTYKYHVIQDGKITWYVLTGDSEDYTSAHFYYLVKVDAHQNVQMYDFLDEQGAKTGLNGLVPAYRSLKGTKVKLGSLVAAYTKQPEFSGYVRQMHSGENWQLPSKK